jgi:hypothetical protein
VQEPGAAPERRPLSGGSGPKWPTSSSLESRYDPGGEPLLLGRVGGFLRAPPPALRGTRWARRAETQGVRHPHSWDSRRQIAPTTRRPTPGRPALVPSETRHSALVPRIAVIPSRQQPRNKREPPPTRRSECSLPGDIPDRRQPANATSSPDPATATETLNRPNQGRCGSGRSLTASLARGRLLRTGTVGPATGLTPQHQSRAAPTSDSWDTLAAIGAPLARCVSS